MHACPGRYRGRHIPERCTQPSNSAAAWDRVHGSSAPARPARALTHDTTLLRRSYDVQRLSFLFNLSDVTVVCAIARPIIPPAKIPQPVRSHVVRVCTVWTSAMRPRLPLPHGDRSRHMGGPILLSSLAGFHVYDRLTPRARATRPSSSTMRRPREGEAAAAPPRRTTGLGHPKLIPNRTDF